MKNEEAEMEQQGPYAARKAIYACPGCGAGYETWELGLFAAHVEGCAHVADEQRQKPLSTWVSKDES